MEVRLGAAMGRLDPNSFIRSGSPYSQCPPPSAGEGLLMTRAQRGRRQSAGAGLVEAAGVEPASEAECPETSTSVSVILLSPQGSSRGDPLRPAAVCSPRPRPRRPRAGQPGFVTPRSRLAGETGGGARALWPGELLYATLRSESEPAIGVGICVP